MEQSFLEAYGFDGAWRALFEKEAPGLTPARVIAQHKTQYSVITESGETRAQVSGRYRNELPERGGYPAVGDMVGIRPGDSAVIETLLPRRTEFYRADSFRGGRQILAANIDTVLICMSLGQNFKAARLIRYLILARESGAMPVVALTKADMCGDIEGRLELLNGVREGVPVHVISSVTGQGLEEIRGYFSRGQTVAALGSSGVGKSTMLNALFGESVMAVNAVREDDERGRHTTVHRQLILMPGGGLYMDTPGLREVGLYDAEDSVADMYEDVEDLTGRCRFSDCTHGSEPGCAVRAAIESGTLSEKRWETYRAQLREARPRKDLLMEKWKRNKEIAKHSRQGKRQRDPEK